MWLQPKIKKFLRFFILVAVPLCDVTAFVDKKTTCEKQIGPCTVLANKMDSKYGTCKAYCSAQELSCIRAWEESNDRCNIISTHDCDHNFGSYTSDALCQCTGMISMPKD